MSGRTRSPGLEPGKRIGDFQLVALLGQGGMGQVWEAVQASLGDRRVAVKFVRPERVSTRQLAFFEREARAAARLSHPGIVSVHGFGESDGTAWIAMELVEGALDPAGPLERDRPRGGDPGRLRPPRRRVRGPPRPRAAGCARQRCDPP